jgi:hypothetical protein
VRTHDYKAEYARRIANAKKRGLSRSQARGHPKPAESSIRTSPGGRPIEDARLQLGLKVLRQEKSLSAAAREARISPERLRRYALDKNLIEKQGRRWSVRHDLPTLLARASSIHRRRRLRVGLQDRPVHGRRRQIPGDKQSGRIGRFRGACRTSPAPRTSSRRGQMLSTKSHHPPIRPSNKSTTLLSNMRNCTHE